MSFSENLRSVDQVAIERGWSPKGIHKLIREGLPVVQVGRQRLINLDTFDRFLASREATVELIWLGSNSNDPPHAALWRPG